MSYTKDQLVQIATDDANKYGIDPTIFQRQINQESGWNPNALSSAGAEGIAQFMPATAAGYGIDPWNPVQALDAAARYDQNTLQSIGATAPYSTDDYKKMLAAYNEGGGALNNQVQHYGSDWLAFAPLETQNYVQNILDGIWPGTGVGTPESPAVQSATQGVTTAEEAIKNIQGMLDWMKNNAPRIALLILALALISAGLFAIGGAV